MQHKSRKTFMKNLKITLALTHKFHGTLDPVLQIWCKLSNQKAFRSRLFSQEREENARTTLDLRRGKSGENNILTCTGSGRGENGSDSDWIQQDPLADPTGRTHSTIQSHWQSYDQTKNLSLLFYWIQIWILGCNIKVRIGSGYRIVELHCHP